jgi:hypothetical protein
MNKIMISIVLLTITSGLYADQNRWQRSSDIVTDTKLQLLWQDDHAAKMTKKSWTDANQYCQSISLGGYSDWRLPSYGELKSIVDHDRHNTAVQSSFQNVHNSDNYWSSTNYNSDEKLAWAVNFYYGYTLYDSKRETYCVRCVRSDK